MDYCEMRKGIYFRDHYYVSEFLNLEINVVSPNGGNVGIYLLNSIFVHTH